MRQEDVARWDEERGVMCMMKHNGLGWRRKHHDVRKRMPWKLRLGDWRDSIGNPICQDCWKPNTTQPFLVDCELYNQDWRESSSDPEIPRGNESLSPQKQQQINTEIGEEIHM